MADEEEIAPKPSVAAQVRKKLEENKSEADGVVALSGLLDDIDAGDPKTRRLYVDDTMTSWLAIEADDIFGTILAKGDEPRDVIFVNCNAQIQHVRACRAHMFMEPRQHGASDPTATDAYSSRGTWPRPRP